MNRRLTVAVTALAVAGLAGLPAHAATKPKAFSGSYSVSLLPDPTTNVTNTAGKLGCTGLLAQGKDLHPLTVPGAGKLTVDLVSPDPTNKGVTDWDLHVVDAASGEIVEESVSATSTEEIQHKFTKSQKLVIQVCNLAGGPTGTVTYKFKP